MSTAPRTFGAYTLLKFLGAGGTGEIWLARPNDPNSALPSPLLIKQLHPGLSQQEGFVRRFEHEAQVISRVQSPHLPRILDAGRVEDSFYIALQYLPGWPLRRIMSDLRESGEQATLPSAVDLVVGLCRGVSALHEAIDPATGTPLGFVHRDITPDNVLLAEDGRAQLLDLGLGTSVIQDWKTATGVVMGSPGYMAPEQVRAEPVDARTDVYAIGVVFWELLTLEPYIARGPMPIFLKRQAEPSFRPPSKLRSDIPEALDAALERALAPSIEDRWPSAAAFETTLREGFGARQSSVEGEMLSTLVGEMLWGELGQDKTDVTQLMTLRTPLPEGLPRAEESYLLPTVASPETLGVPAGLAPAVLSQETPQPLVRPVVEGGVTPHGSLAPSGFTPLPAGPPPSTGGLPLWSVIVLMLVTLLAGISIGAFVLGTREGWVEPAPVVPGTPLTPDETSSAADVGPPGAVKAEARARLPEVDPQGAERGGAERRTGDPEVSPPPKSTEPRRQRRRRAPRPKRSAQEAPDLEAQLVDLLKRSRALLPGTAARPKRRQLEALIANISREMAAPKAATVARLKAQLEAFERAEK